MAVRDHKIFIVGCGSIGKRHAECLRDIGIEKFVFFDPEHEKAEALASTYGGIAVASYEEGLATDADCVYVLSPTRLHIPQAKAALESDKHVFLEKPLSDSLDGVDELSDLAKEKDLVAEVGFCFRFHDGIRELKRRFDNNEIGKLVSIRATMGEHFPDMRPDYLSTYYVKYSGAFELVHDLDLAIYLAGTDVIDCNGFFGSFSELGFESPDTVEILLRFEKHLANVHLDFFQSPRTRTMTLLGTKGTMVLDFSTWDSFDFSIFTRASGKWESFSKKTARNDMFRAESLNFIGAIEGTEENLCPISEAKKSLAVVKKINPDQ